LTAAAVNQGDCAGQRRDLKWHSYEPKPEVKSVGEFASLVSEDAQACFFGKR
jgi:hypothetical protein